MVPSELFENNIHQGLKTVRVQARAALCAFSEGDKNAATEFECSYTEEGNAPRICWPTIIENLDHEGFYIQDETTFSLLISCYRHASQDPFPIAAVCGNIWRNTEGQLSFLKYVISAAPKVFTFAHCKR
ncbi:CCR4-NOT transcription complex subunit 1 [Tanacetum coccineum]